ncbi:MAG: putative membrane protein YfcA [Verrucomicrobiales bacterium]|jgi:uncharacterized membrane protein YfcA
MVTELILPLLFGAIVGFSLGLTGGGGSIFAVPLLIFGLGTGVREAVGISLAAVGATALFGALLRLRRGEVELPTGLVFAAAGMLGAPLGTWIGAQLPDTVTLVGFATLMGLVGIRMWRGSVETQTGRSTCARDESGKLTWNTECAAGLTLVGLLAGILSGIFGVGGGFIIVPALILATRMPVHRAVSTSLLVISLICLSGIISYAWTGPAISPSTTSVFVIGGFVGMFAGAALRSQLPTRTLNRIFAAGMWAVSVWIVLRTAN